MQALHRKAPAGIYLLITYCDSTHSCANQQATLLPGFQKWIIPSWKNTNKEPLIYSLHLLHLGQGLQEVEFITFGER